MSSSKSSRKQKMIAKKNADALRDELKRLKIEKDELEREFELRKKEKVKGLHIRNLKIIGNTCNFLAPFVVTAGITAGIFVAFGGGLPFHVDEITKYKMYDLHYDTDYKGNVTFEEEYRTNYWFDDNPLSSSLVIYSPWKKRDGQYSRIKRTYKLGELSSLDLFNAVLKEDYAFIEENLKNYQEEIQTTNKINEEFPNDYLFQASLHLLDKEDTLKYNETDKKNIIITFFEIVLSIGIGSLIAWRRDFDFFYEIKEVNDEYRITLRRFNKTKEALDDINQKMLTLSSKKR